MSLSDDEQRLDRLVAAVRRSGKYRRIDPAFVRSVGARELGKHAGFDEAIKATKRKLHQVVGAYQTPGREIDSRIDALIDAYRDGDEARIRAASLEAMRTHASTRERLPILADLYGAIFELLSPVRSVLDLACGLNPLALPWMNLANGASYLAVDVDEQIVAALNRVFAAAPIDGRAEARDVTRDPPTEPVDLALIFKAIPCLEQIDREAGARLLETINARYAVVSFPGRSLGGRRKGMPITYAAHFESLIAGRNQVIARLDYPSELVFVVALTPASGRMQCAATR